MLDYKIGDVVMKKNDRNKYVIIGVYNNAVDVLAMDREGNIYPAKDFIRKEDLEYTGKHHNLWALFE